MTKTLDISKASENYAEWFSLARAGTEIVLTDQDTPVLRIVPVAPVSKKRTENLIKGAIWISEDFNDPLPDEFWEGKS